MEDFDILTFYSRLSKLEKEIRQIKNLDRQPDLHKIWSNMLGIHKSISQEQVNCRRLKRTTHDYQVLVDKFNDHAHQLEQLILMAKLMD